MYLPFDSIDGNQIPGGTYDGTVIGGSEASQVDSVLGNGLSITDTVVTIGDRRDSCFWLPDLCTDGFTYSVWIKLGIIYILIMI